jgi:hypothetical protein
MSVSDKTDLNRWNRAGLKRFEYINGNAATFLERLRRELAREGRFKDKWTDLDRVVPFEVDEQAVGYEREELLRKRSEQLLAQYWGERRDWAWETTRGFARACHILAGYLDAYANEAYIGTASQWDNVRRMVELLDYHPAPPASASTRLVLVPKEGKSGVVEKGFQIKHTPEDGGPSVIFETLEDLTVDSALHELRAEGWDRSEQEAETSVWRSKGRPRVFPGDVVMILNESTMEANAVEVERVDETDGIEFVAFDDQYSWKKWTVGYVSIHSSPRWKRECWLNGSMKIIRTKEPHGFTATKLKSNGETVSSYIGWDESRNVTGTWDFSNIKHAKIEAVDERSIYIDYSDDLPVEGTELFELLSIFDPVMPAKFNAVVLKSETGDISSPEIIPVAPELADSPILPAHTPQPIFTVKERIGTPPSLPGGGLLPPASLPEIGSFLFPSPFLPMDLVKAAVEMLLSLGVMQIPSTGDFVIKGLPLESIPEDVSSSGTDLEKAANNLFVLLNNLQDPDSGEKLIDWHDDLNTDALKKGAIKSVLESYLDRAGEEPTVLFNEIKALKDGTEDGPLLATPEEPKVQAIVADTGDAYLFDGNPDINREGDWVLGLFDDDSYKALKIEAINLIGGAEDTFSVQFKYVSDTGLTDFPARQGLKEIQSDFRGEPFVAEGAGSNNSDFDTGGIVLEKNLSGVLKKGQYVILTATGKEAVLARVDSVGEDGKTVVTDPAIDSLGFTKGELVIYGNVVLAGHGERMPDKILGSGDATQSNQSFLFEVDGVSFIADETMSSGVAADIDVIVDGRIWKQVSSLKDSGPTDIHYSVHMTEEGYLKISFGDGEYGRRLPTGLNNVRIAYRKGSGLAGNINAAGLKKAVKPHRLVESVLQPMDTTGGNDMEVIESVREHAPASVLTLSRAVSLVDFEYLAASDSRVWQAKAFSRVSVMNRHENVEVVIVPAGGGDLGELATEVKLSLQAKALPGVNVTVSPYIEVPLDVNVTVRVKEDEFNAETVVDAVKNALLDVFSLKKGRLGEHLYLSRVYQVVENVAGVERSVCVIDGNPELKVKNAGPEHLIYLNEEKISPEVNFKAYTL